MSEEEFTELAAGHVLRALSPQDERAFAEARAEHPEWEHYLAEDNEALASLAELPDEVPPPAWVRAELLDVIMLTAQEREDSRGDGGAEPSPTTTMIQTIQQQKWTRTMFTLAASFLVVIALGFGAASLGQWFTRPASVVALDEVDAAQDSVVVAGDVEAGGTVSVHWSESLGRVVLVVEGVAPTGSNTDYEVWFVSNEVAVSAGTFDPSGGDATVILDGQLGAGDTIAVTVEPEGGSPSGAPTSDPIVAVVAEDAL